MKHSAITIPLWVLALVLMILGQWRLTPVHRADIVAAPTGLKLDLNSASAPSLTLLPGVGMAAAERIVADRRPQARGRFLNISDLRRVRGFSQRGVANVEPYVRVAQQKGDILLFDKHRCADVPPSKK